MNHMVHQVIVTGGSGFLGSAVLRALRVKHADWDIYNLDSRSPAGNLNVRYEYADITQADQVDRVFACVKPDLVIHTAGLSPGGQQRYSNDALIRNHTFSINVDGTKNVVAAARRHDCKCFVYTSSCTVVTDDQNHDYPYMDESTPIGHATLVYGSSKVYFMSQRRILEP